MLKEIPIDQNTSVNLEVLDLGFHKFENLFFETLADLEYREIYSAKFSGKDQFERPAAGAFADRQIQKNLKNRKELYLSKRKIICLNENIKHLLNLTRLTLSDKKLIDLNEALDQLHKLNYMHLSDKELERLSTKFIQLKPHKQMHSCDKLHDQYDPWLIGNEPEVPPKQIWQANNIKKLYNYLSDYDQMDLNSVFYSKLMFFGHTDVRKSYLIWSTQCCITDTTTAQPRIEAWTKSSTCKKPEWPESFTSGQRTRSSGSFFKWLAIPWTSRLTTCSSR